MLLYYTFENGSGTVVTDSSGNGFDLDTVSSPTWVTGRVGTYAMSFDKSLGQYAVRSDDPLLDITGNLTIAAWIFLDSTTKENIIIAKGDGAIAFNYNFGVNTSAKLKLYGTSPHFVSTATISTGVWTHVAVVFNGSTATFYKNGSPVDSPSGALGSANNGDLVVGWNIYNPDPSYFDGDIDEIRVYTTALSDSDILAIYNADQTTTSTTSSSSSTSSTSSSTSSTSSSSSSTSSTSSSTSSTSSSSSSTSHSTSSTSSSTSSTSSSSSTSSTSSSSSTSHSTSSSSTSSTSSSSSTSSTSTSSTSSSSSSSSSTSTTLPPRRHPHIEVVLDELRGYFG